MSKDSKDSSIRKSRLNAKIDKLTEELRSWKQREHEARVMSKECMLCPHLGNGDPLVDPVAKDRDTYRKERDMLLDVTRFLVAYLNPPTRVDKTYDPKKLRGLMQHYLDIHTKWVKDGRKL